MLLVLIMNGIEAMPDGGLVTLEATVAAAPESFVLKVTDTGVGIPPEDLDRIFEPFYTTKEQGKGVGLGLAVVYGIVKRHHGSITIESTVGSGTTVVLPLPLVQAEDAAEPFALPGAVLP